MKTILDQHHALHLMSSHYNGVSLIAEVGELVASQGGRVSAGKCRYSLHFFRPVAHLLNEEFPVTLAANLQGTDQGFLRIVENQALRCALGLDDEQFSAVQIFALITLHEVLLVFCETPPEIIDVATDVTVGT